MTLVRDIALIAVLACLFGCSKSGRPQTPTTAAPAAPPMAMGSDSMPRVPQSMVDWARGAMLFDGLGEFHRAITTSSPESQQYFDQGMRFMWAFNHDEATRSFAKAAELDPTCAACFWGLSLTVGPNYNLPFMSEERAKVASDALAKAREFAPHAAPVEGALINALAKRYPNAKALDPASAAPVLADYANAMKSVAAQFSGDLDVQTLYAESLMNLNAWKLWTADGKPVAGTEQIVAVLEAVLARDPLHVGANHYYVHTLEGSAHPEQATASAERLKTLMPAAGHLVHMPGHIFQRVGRYEDAAEANRQALAADGVYLSRTRPLDYYPMYTAHNYQFLAYSAATEGRKAETLAATANSRRMMSDAMLLTMPGVDWYVAESYAAQVRFGLWDELLAASAPNHELPGLMGGYIFGRGVALAAKGRIDEAKAALGELQHLAAASASDAPAGQNTLKQVLAIAVPIVQARIAAAEHRSDDAASLLRQAVAAEDRLAYDEPKNWFFPARHLLGAQLLQAGNAAEAEAVFRQDLRQNPANGWALYGLSAALKAQGKRREADKATKQFKIAWQNADIQLSASAY
jgi:tetratricopeptide (TPR) repeat protein